MKSIIALSIPFLAAAAADACSGAPVEPGDPGAADVRFTIDTTTGQRTISRYIYGVNQGDFNAEAKGLTLARVGGKRLSAYNWETNASNAGAESNHRNDAQISSSSVAGAPMKSAVQAASDAGASIIMTVPMAGWVAADTNGPCEPRPASNAVIAERFHPILARKGSAFAYPPNTADSSVYADEFVAWLESQFPAAQTDPARRIFYMLDNEPDLWSHTHSEMHPNPVTYDGLVQKSVEFAGAIKGVAPNAQVFGPVSYGWYGYVTLQDAPDGSGRDFLDFYLSSMAAAESTAGKRLIDVLDLHWYPEVQADGRRIIEGGTSPAEVEARLQAPRSLWDSSYTEASWIAEWGTFGPVRLIPRLMQKIATHYPGTKLSISEYNYGAGQDISGGIAQADVLGIFGREGLFAANVWPAGSSNAFLYGAFAMYRNYDGQGAAFGETSVNANTSTADLSSVYASTTPGSSNVLVVTLNKAATPLRAGITIKHTASLETADVYTLTASNSTPARQASLSKVATNAFSYLMPARSVSTLVFRP